MPAAVGLKGAGSNSLSIFTCLRGLPHHRFQAQAGLDARRRESMLKLIFKVNKR